jgi:hypothetical protein
MSASDEKYIVMPMNGINYTLQRYTTHFLKKIYTEIKWNMIKKSLFLILNNSISKRIQQRN